MRGVVAVLAALAVMPAVLGGQVLRGYVGGGGGLISPAGSFGDVDNVGWQVWGSAVRPLGGALGVTLDALYGQTGHRDGVEGKSTLLGGTAGVALFLRGADRRVRPFLAAGLGVFRVSVEVPTFGSAVATKLAPVVGGGLMVGRGSRRGFLTARYVSVRTSPEATSFFPISAGIVFSVGAR